MRTSAMICYRRGFLMPAIATLLALAAPLDGGSTARAGELVQGRASVIDGDTLDIHGQRIRLHGIDAPESSQLCQRAGRPWRCGQEAALQLDSLINGRPVSCEVRDTDRYGRAVAVCSVGGREVNAWLVRQGLAMAYRRYSTDYVANEERAEQEGAGIWSSDFQAPWKWRSTRRSDGASTADKDCGDFRSRREAQAFYEAAGPGDPHQLDADGDGEVCETLP